MSTNYVPSTSSDTSDRPKRTRRRRRSSSDRPSGDSSRSSQRSSSNGSSSKKAPAKKLSFFDKVVAFFAGSPAEEASSQNRQRTQHPTIAAAEARQDRPERPERAPRAERSERAERPARTGMRKPEVVDVTTPRVYVGNLSFDATEPDIQELFSGIGIVQSVEIVSNRQTQRSKGFGFVQMQTIEEAKRAVDELHDREYMGRKLVVSGAKASDRRDDRAQQPEQ